MLASLGPLDRERGRIRAALFRQSTIKLASLAEQIEGIDSTYTPYLELNELLVAAPALDFPDQVVRLPAETCGRWGISVEDAYAIGMQNLAAATDGGAFMRPLPELTVVAIDDGYNSSRALLPQIWSQLPARGRLVALAPHRDQLVFADSASLDALAFLCTAAESAWDAMGPPVLCTVPLVFEEGGLACWMPPRDHPHYPRLRRQRLAMDEAAHASLKALLDRYDEQNGDPPGTMPYRIELTQDGVPYSVTGYVLGTEARLPAVDVILVKRSPDDEPRTLDWGAFATAAGELMANMNMTPPLHTVSKAVRPRIEGLLRG